MQHILTLAVAVVLAAAPLMAESPMPKMMYKSTETPTYTVIRREGAVELRTYAPRITAEVAVTGPRLIAINKGFSVLAGYIFGGNQSQSKVAMTTPVAQAASEKIAMTSPVGQSEIDGVWTVQFTMPSGYMLETLPKPNDARITFAQHPAQRQVAIQFAGIATQSALSTAESNLRAAAATMGLTLGAGPFYYFYDAPMTLPWNRRNEVAFVVN